jgi:hypothetical protein
VYSGSNLTIQAEGTVNQFISSSATVNVYVMLGVLTLYHSSFDICESVGQVELACPLQNGPITISKTVSIPSSIPDVRGLCDSSLKSPRRILELLLMSYRDRTISRPTPRLQMEKRLLVSIHLYPLSSS